MGRRIASAGLVARIQRKTKDAAYSSTGFLIRQVTEEYDEYNQPVTNETLVPVEGNYSDKVSKERWLDYADAEEISGEFRLETKPEKGDRLRVVGLFDGTTYEDQDFEIVGIRDRDVFGYVCALKKVEV